MPTTDDTHLSLPCPACNKRGVASTLSPGGALDGHGCRRCGGLLIPPSGSERLLYDELALDRATLLEIAHGFGGKRFACPSCKSHVRALMVRGVNVDLCFHCGSLWLDHGELERLSSDRYVSPARTEVAPIDVVAMVQPDATLRFDSRPPWRRFFSDGAGVSALGFVALALNAASTAFAVAGVVAGAAYLATRGHDDIDIFPRARRYVRSRRWLLPTSPRDSDARVLDDNRAVVVRPFLGFADISLVDGVGRTLVDIAFIRRGLAVSEAAMWARRLGADVIVHPALSSAPTTPSPPWPTSPSRAHDLVTRWMPESSSLLRLDGVIDGRVLWTLQNAVPAIGDEDLDRRRALAFYVSHVKPDGTTSVALRFHHDPATKHVVVVDGNGDAVVTIALHGPMLLPTHTAARVGHAHRLRILPMGLGRLRIVDDTMAVHATIVLDDGPAHLVVEQTGNDEAILCTALFVQVLIDRRIAARPTR